MFSVLSGARCASRACQTGTLRRMAASTARRITGRALERLVMTAHKSSPDLSWSVRENINFTFIVDILRSIEKSQFI